LDEYKESNVLRLLKSLVEIFDVPDDSNNFDTNAAERRNRNNNRVRSVSSI
jgi:hypothetical protein